MKKVEKKNYISVILSKKEKSEWNKIKESGIHLRLITKMNGKQEYVCGHVNPNFFSLFFCDKSVIDSFFDEKIIEKKINNEHMTIEIIHNKNFSIL